MLRLFIATVLEPGVFVEVPTAQFAHLQARRVRDGERVSVFNGDGYDVFGTLRFSGRRTAVVELSDRAPGLGFAEPFTEVALSVIAADRMDWAIQKCAELGIARLTPLLAQRSQQATLAHRKRAHWHAVAISAAQQCGRARIMEIAAPLSVPQWCAETNPAGRYFAHAAATMSAATLLCDALAIAIGPEGGWTDDEIRSFEAARCVGIRLGDATLRSETAAVAAAACVTCR